MSYFSRRAFVFGLFAAFSLGLGGCKRAPTATEKDSSASETEALNTASHHSTSLKPKALRLVSLSPGVTETVIALGKGSSLVGLSDYCSWNANEFPEPLRVGSAITPNYESIARVQPTLILASEVAGDQLKPLSRLAPTHSLPWLTLKEFTESINALGRLIHAETEARDLSQKIESQLSVLPPPHAPRVLLALDYGDSGTNETWFIRRNSIHGAVLHAAGAQNAVALDISGPPKLSPEQLLALDPDAIIVLRSSAKDAASEARTIAHFKRWSPLRAVRENRIAVLSIEGSLAVGPSVLNLSTHLKRAVNEIMEVQP